MVVCLDGLDVLGVIIGWIIMVRGLSSFGRVDGFARLSTEVCVCHGQVLRIK